MMRLQRPTGRARRHVRENALGNLEMAASLAFFYFQQLGWK
jgi:hypothetical protein